MRGDLRLLARLILHLAHHCCVWLKWRPRGYRVYYYPLETQKILDDLLGKRGLFD